MPIPKNLNKTQPEIRSKVKLKYLNLNRLIESMLTYTNIMYVITYYMLLFLFKYIIMFFW